MANFLDDPESSQPRIVISNCPCAVLSGLRSDRCGPSSLGGRCHLTGRVGRVGGRYLACYFGRRSFSDVPRRATLPLIKFEKGMRTPL
jgi:hypothetical protein